MPQFVDRAVLHLKAGDGGHGCNSVRREKFVPLGGPDGGNGGHGGDIILEVSPQVHTLLDFHFHPHITSPRGGNGAGDNRHGARGKDTILPVPEGTVVFDASGAMLADLTGRGTRMTIAQGGHGGLGNAALVSRTRKAPGFALLGEPGETKDITLELKSMADVGLIGFPSAGKSSLISVLSAAKPKIADYPFTTLAPNLGVVRIGHDVFTIADVPGLIPGASQGKGLGLDFLRHIERTAVLAHVVDAATVEAHRNPADDIRALENELANYQSALQADTGLGDLRDRPRIIILNKMDVPEAEEMADIQEEELKEFGWPIYRISTVAKHGLKELSFALADIVKNFRATQPTPATTSKKLIPAGVRASGRGGHFAQFEVTRDKNNSDSFIVTGDKLRRWIAQTDFDNDEAVGFLADRLAKAGVEEALWQAGAQEGSEVTIGEITFEWDPQTAAGVDITPTGRGTDQRLEQNKRSTAQQRKRASQARRGLIDEYDFGDGQEADTERWQG